MKILILTLLMMVSSVLGELSVLDPPELRDKFKYNKVGYIQSKMANFGHIPYGQSVIGSLYFNISNLDGCYVPRH